MSGVPDRFYQAQEWESRQGQSTIERTAQVGRQALQVRKRRDLRDASARDRYHHVHFIHRLGQDALSTQPRSRPSTLPEEISRDDVQQTLLAFEKKEQELEEKLHGNLDTEKLLSSLDALDGDDDSFDHIGSLVVNAYKWSDDLVETVCVYLLSQFRSSSDEKKMQRAEAYLSELHSRHRNVAHILEQHLHYLIHQSTHQLLHRGRCTCQLGYLRIIKHLAIKFPRQMTEFKFCHRFAALLMIDLNLAASVIQLSFRKRNFSKYYLIYDRTRADKLNGDDFLSVEDSKELFERQYAMRLREIFRVWRPMQRHRSSLEFSFRRFPHIDAKYVTQGLEIVRMLISSADVDIAAVNRRDVIESHLLILLPQLLLRDTTNASQFVCSDIVYSLTLSVHSLPSVLSMNIIASCVDVLILQKDTIRDENSKALYGAVRNVANHNAGLRRAIEKYDFIQPSNHDSPAINYLKHLSLNVEERNWVLALGSSVFIRHLMTTIMGSQSLNILQVSLACLLSLSCGSCRQRVVDEVGMLSGKFIFRLADLFEETDLSAYSLAIFLQLCTDPAGRRCLLSSSSADALKPLLSEGPAYSNPAYHYAVYIICSLYRVDHCRPYNPTSVVEILRNTSDIQLVVIDELVRTITHQHGTSKPTKLVEMLNYAQLSKERQNFISSTACECGARYLADYLSNPSHVEYYRSLTTLEHCSRTLIFDCLSSTVGTCLLISSQSSLRFLSHCVFYSSYLFQGKPMGNTRAKLVLRSALHALQALRNILVASRSCETLCYLLNINKELDLLEASAFFIKTLSTFHTGLSDELKLIQQCVGVSAIKFMDAFMYALLDPPYKLLSLLSHPINSCLKVTRLSLA